MNISRKDKNGFYFFYPLLRTFGQLLDPALRNVLLISSASALLLLALLVSLASWGLAFLRLLDWSWANTILQLLGGLVTLMLAWFLFPTIVGLLSGLWSGKVALAVEARHYPTLSAPLANPLWRDIVSGLRLAGWSLALNLLILPLYLLLPGVNLLIFCLVNGFLLAREYFSQVAMRRLDDAALAQAWQQNRGRLWVSGMLLALLASIPLLNLLTPVLGTAFMVHVFEDLRRQGRLP